MIQRKIEVGIMSAPEISFEILQRGGGVETAAFCEGRILYRGRLHDELCFEEGRLMKQYVTGTEEEKEEAKAVLSVINGRVDRLRKKYIQL